MNAEHIITIERLEDIERKASEFLNLCKNHFFFAFYGNLGAGKTTFIKSICETLGCEDEVVSPTYSLINEYHIKSTNQSSKAMIYHMDFYRLKSLEEAIDIGVEDYFYDGNAYCFVEWPELAEQLFPEDIVKVSMTANHKRTLRINL